MFSVPVPNIPIDVKTVFFSFEVIATFAFALSGLFVALARADSALLISGGPIA